MNVFECLGPAFKAGIVNVAMVWINQEPCFSNDKLKDLYWKTRYSQFPTNWNDHWLHNPRKLKIPVKTQSTEITIKTQ